MSRFRYFFAAPLAMAMGWCIGPGPAAADDVSKKQKAVAEENLAKAELPKGAAVVEGDAVIVAGVLPPGRLKTIAGFLSKTNKVARAALQYAEKDEAWKGKLTVYYVTERKDFAQFMRLVVGARPEGNYHIAVRSDEPFVVGGLDLDAKATDRDIAAELGPLLAGAMLQAKAGTATTLPPWVRLGFGRSVALRAEGAASKRYSSFRTQARRAVLGGVGKPGAPIADVWGGTREDGALLATSLMDFFAFGQGKESFDKFLSALRPGENGQAPTMDMVIENAGWKKAADLEKDWKKWVRAGSRAK